MDFARLARRITAWTTNGLVSLLILVAGWGFGRQVLRWWGADAASTEITAPPVAATDGLADSARLHELQFGNSPWRIYRQTLAGDRARAVAALLDDARHATAQAALPGDPAETGEQELLRRIALTKPVQAEGPWQLYQLEADFPMVVGTRQVPASQAAKGPATGSPAARRVVTWGLAVPESPATWNLYTFQWAGDSQRPESDAFAAPAPPGGTRTLSLRACDGGGMVALSGPWQPEAWKVSFDQWFQAHGWAGTEAWQWSGSTWRRRFVRPGDGAAETVDVRFGPGGEGRASGLLLIQPAIPTTKGNARP